VLPSTGLRAHKVVVHIIRTRRKEDNTCLLEITGLKITPTGGQKY